MPTERHDYQGEAMSTLNNVRDFGAKGDDATDDRIAIQAAIDDAKATHKAGVFFPGGPYRVSRTTAPGTLWSLDLHGVDDMALVGERPASVVKLMNTTGP